MTVLPVKKLILFVLLLFIGCSSEIYSGITHFFISPKVYSNYLNCSQYINRYNDLQDEKKILDVEFVNELENESLSDEQKQEYEARILDLSFQVENALTDWEDCKSRHSNEPL